MRKWEEMIQRYIVSAGIPGFRWNGSTRRFTGIKGLQFARAMPRNEGGWAHTPEFFRRYERDRNDGSGFPFVMFLTSKDNGPNIEDTFVLTRLDTFATLLKNAVHADPARYLGDN